MVRLSVLSNIRNRRLTAGGGDGTDSESVTKSAMRRSPRWSSSGSSSGNISSPSHDGLSDTTSAAGEIHATDVYTVNSPKTPKRSLKTSSSAGDLQPLEDRPHSPCMTAPFQKVKTIRRRLPFGRKSKKNVSASTMEEIALGLPVVDGSCPKPGAAHDSPPASPRASMEREKQKRLGQLSGSERTAYVDFLRREIANGDAVKLGLSDNVLSFIYRCHKEDIDRSRQAVATFLKFKNFHTNNVKKGAVTVTEDMIENENSFRKHHVCITPGADGTPIVFSYNVARRHQRSGNGTLSEKVCQLLYGLELIVAAVEERGAEFIFVFDIKSLSVKNADITYMQQVACLQKVFRDLMKRIYIVNGGCFAMSVWKMAKPLFSPRILEKIRVVKGDNFKSSLPVADHELLPRVIQASWDLNLRKAEEEEYIKADRNTAFCYTDFTTSPK